MRQREHHGINNCVRSRQASLSPTEPTVTRTTGTWKRFIYASPMWSFAAHGDPQAHAIKVDQIMVM
jgi:hypothetical protein